MLIYEVVGSIGTTLALFLHVDEVLEVSDIERNDSVRIGMVPVSGSSDGLC